MLLKSFSNNFFIRENDDAKMNRQTVVIIHS